jgi:phospholipid-translocating ATPase
MLATQLPAVAACRCSPTQKADVARLIREYTKKTVCCIGDGGNDVSMIQAADVGIGIVGKEGKQASLAADFSINQFSYLTKLLLWHGRNSYKRSAKLSQFVIHRGLIIAVIQAVFSSIFFFARESFWTDGADVQPLLSTRDGCRLGMLHCTPWLLSFLWYWIPMLMRIWRYSTQSCTRSSQRLVFTSQSLVLIRQGRSLSYRTFFTWLTISVYQGKLE